MQAATKHIADRHSYFAKSGFTPIDDQTGCFAYARRLTQYISDASTVRARTLDHFGKAPSVDAIRKMRDMHLVLTRRVSDEGYKAGLRSDPAAMVLAAAEPEEAELEPEVIVALALAEPVHVVAAPVAPVKLISAVDVIEACAAEFGLSYGEIVGSTRERHVVRPRMLVCAILKARGGTYPVIGRRIGRDHSTVIHAVRRFFSALISEPPYINAWLKYAPAHARECRTLVDLELACQSERV